VSPEFWKGIVAGLIIVILIYGAIIAWLWMI